ncbi:MAG: hypothetical protein ACMXYG_06460 [Candidatus Woesearchaeota archaeon]
MAISYNAIKNNSRLTQFHGTKELVLINSVPKINVRKEADKAIQSQLFQF